MGDPGSSTLTLSRVKERNRLSKEEKTGQNSMPNQKALSKSNVKDTSRGFNAIPVEVPSSSGKMLKHKPRSAMDSTWGVPNDAETGETKKSRDAASWGEPLWGCGARLCSRDHLSPRRYFSSLT